MVLVSYILNRGYNGSEEGLDAAIAEFEEAIRAEAARGFVVTTEPESQALARLTSDFASSEAENRRIQAVLIRTQEERDRYRTELEDLVEVAYATHAEAHNKVECGPLHSQIKKARRALSPTESPSEEK